MFPTLWGNFAVILIVVSFQSVIPLFLHQYDTHAALFQRYDMALIQVAYSLLESLLAHLEAVVDIFCVALVAKR